MSYDEQRISDLIDGGLLQKNAQRKCDHCKFKKRYTTGGDEYPAYTTLEYCSKGHWADENDVGYRENCADYLSDKS